MSTTVKQSSYKKIKRLYEETSQDISAIYSRYQKAENEIDEDIRDEMHEEIYEEIKGLLQKLNELNEKLKFIVVDTNTTSKAKEKYVRFLKDTADSIKLFEYIKEDIGISW